MENLPKINILEELLLLQQKHHIHLCGYKITHLKSHYRCILPGARGIKFIYEHQKRIYTATKHFEWEYLRYIVKIFIFGLLLGGTNHKPIKLAQRIKYIRLLNRLNQFIKKAWEEVHSYDLILYSEISKKYVTNIMQTNSLK